MTAVTLIAVARWLFLSAAAVALAAVVAWLGLRVLTPPEPIPGQVWYRPDRSGWWLMSLRVVATDGETVEIEVTTRHTLPRREVWTMAEWRAWSMTATRSEVPRG